MTQEMAAEEYVRLFAATPKPRQASRSELEDALAQAFAFACSDLPQPERQYRFDPTRKWRADFAWPALRLLVECEGGVYTQGRHTRASGFIKDTEKYNRASELGWTLLRYTRREITSGRALNEIERLVRERMQ